MGMELWGGRGSALLPAPPGRGESVPAGKGGRRPGGLRRGGTGPSRARHSCHVVSHPLDSFPKKYFLLLQSGVKACVGRAGAHSPRVARCRRWRRRRRWGAGAPCLGAELPRHPTAPTAPVPSPPRHDPAASAARMKRCCPGTAWVSVAVPGSRGLLAPVAGCPGAVTTGGLETRGSGVSSTPKLLAPPPAEHLGLGSASPKRLQCGTATGTSGMAQP